MAFFSVLGSCIKVATEIYQYLPTEDEENAERLEYVLKELGRFETYLAGWNEGIVAEFTDDIERIHRLLGEMQNTAFFQTKRVPAKFDRIERALTSIHRRFAYISPDSGRQQSPAAAGSSAGINTSGDSVGDTSEKGSSNAGSPVRRGDLSMLVPSKAYIAIWGSSYVVDTAKSGEVQLITAMVESRPDSVKWTYKGETPLMAAAANGHVEVCKVLLEVDKTDINAAHKTTKDTSLILASREGHEAVCRELLQCTGIDIDVKNDKGNTALLEAAHGGHDGVCSYLIASRADACQKNSKGLTALHVSVVKDRQAVCDVLVTSSSRNDFIDIQTEQGETALVLAAQHHRSGAVASLLAANASVLLPTRKGNTPLHVAAMEGLHKICTILLRRNSSTEFVNIRNVDRKTAFEAAIDAAKYPVVEAMAGWLSPLPEVMLDAYTRAVLVGQGHRRTEERQRIVEVLKEKIINCMSNKSAEDSTSLLLEKLNISA